MSFFCVPHPGLRSTLFGPLGVFPRNASIFFIGSEAGSGGRSRWIQAYDIGPVSGRLRRCLRAVCCFLFVVCRSMCMCVCVCIRVCGYGCVHVYADRALGHSERVVFCCDNSLIAFFWHAVGRSERIRCRMWRNWRRC